MNLAKYIDHTLLKPDATSTQIKKLCDEAIENNFFAVCVNSSWVKLSAQCLKNSSVRVACVIGFPLGAMSTPSKVFETAQAVEDGAAEIDMVVHLGQLKDKNFSYVETDIGAVVQAARPCKVKVILETSFLSKEEKVKVCELAIQAGAHFVKTSTGFGGGGASLEDIQLMKSVVKDAVEIKASGGIKTTEFAESLIAAGASRLGTSSGVALLKNQSFSAEGY